MGLNSRVTAAMGQPPLAHPCRFSRAWLELMWVNTDCSLLNWGSAEDTHTLLLALQTRKDKHTLLLDASAEEGQTHAPIGSSDEEGHTHVPIGCFSRGRINTRSYCLFSR